MENGLLKEIIEVEKEIQKTLDREKEKMGEWVEIRKREIEEELSRREKDILQSFQVSREEAAREARNRASHTVLEAEQQTNRLAQLTDPALAGIVANHIIKVLPG